LIAIFDQKDSAVTEDYKSHTENLFGLRFHEVKLASILLSQLISSILYFPVLIFFSLMSTHNFIASVVREQKYSYEKALTCTITDSIIDIIHGARYAPDNNHTIEIFS
jgi:hypothetical protein